MTISPLLFYCSSSDDVAAPNWTATHRLADLFRESKTNEKKSVSRFFWFRIHIIIIIYHRRRRRDIYYLWLPASAIVRQGCCCCCCCLLLLVEEEGLPCSRWGIYSSSSSSHSSPERRRKEEKNALRVCTPGKRNAFYNTFGWCCCCCACLCTFFFTVSPFFFELWCGGAAVRCTPPPPPQGALAIGPPHSLPSGMSRLGHRFGPTIQSTPRSAGGSTRFLFIPSKVFGSHLFSERNTRQLVFLFLSFSTLSRV